MGCMNLRVILAVLCISIGVCSAVRSPLSTLAAAADAPVECGKPYGPCGSAIPSGVKCEKGPGWCQAGYYCGWKENTKQPSACLPIPANCGTLGYACCPSNTDKPHTSMDDKLTRNPFCKDGSYCFYFEAIKGLNNGDMYAGNPGAYACRAVPKNCGTGPGTPCCPSTYHISVNPPLTNTGCGGKDSSGRINFCNYESKEASTRPPGYDWPTGTCTANPLDCGTFGKPCCVFTGGGATGTKCGPYFNEPGYGTPGSKGYCANPPGFKGAGQAPLKDLICTQCPETVDSSAKDSNPDLYYACASQEQRQKDSGRPPIISVPKQVPIRSLPPVASESGPSRGGPVAG